MKALLADPEVEGIYETKVPLEFNAILQSGCVCKVDKTAKKRNIKGAIGFNAILQSGCVYAVTFGNVYADAILQHLYRWLCSPQSKLHDPALHRILHKVMQMVFALLLADFRKLGATIIFANFSKVIIDTGKFDLSAAKAYCDSLLKTLQNRDLFEWIELEPLNFWHSLLFMDQGIDTVAEGEIPLVAAKGYDGNKTIGYRLYRELMPFLFLRSFKRFAHNACGNGPMVLVFWYVA
uniref:DNA polymerase epsilon catalytic subunit n=1 Tax=Fagus sylvatica TaxID=28930 RepID=A0A2N9H1P4_FAGSY